MPNTLDFDVVFKEFGRLDETGNVAVLSAIIVALLLYLLVVIFGRRADKRDKAKVKSRNFFFSMQTNRSIVNNLKKKCHKVTFKSMALQFFLKFGHN